MITFIVCFAVVYLAGFVLMALAVQGSPVGYEDQNGFSPGDAPREDDGELFRDSRVDRD